MMIESTLYPRTLKRRLWQLVQVLYCLGAAPFVLYNQAITHLLFHLTSTFAYIATVIESNC